MQKIHMYLLPANSSEEFPVLEGETKKKSRIRITTITIGSERSQHSSDLLFLLLPSFPHHLTQYPFLSAFSSLYILLILTSLKFPSGQGLSLLHLISAEKGICTPLAPQGK